MKTSETILELLAGKNTVAKVKDWLQKNRNKGRSALAHFLCAALNITDRMGKPRITGVHVALRLQESRGFWKLPKPQGGVKTQQQPRRLNTAVPAPQGAMAFAYGMEFIRLRDHDSTAISGVASICFLILGFLLGRHLVSGRIDFRA